MFCFCFKDKSAAIFMAFTNLIVGVLGVFYFAPKVYNENNYLGSDYLCFAVASLEQPTFISVYQVLQISTISIFVAHIIFFQTGLILYFQLLAPCLCKYSYVFCGTHDMPLRGKQADEGVLLDLLKLRIDSGDNKLKSHFEKCRRNAIYTSPRIQNELINLCGEVIQENVISEVRKTMAYSILADETADVSGKEQLSIGVRFYDESKSKIREEFVGFVELKAQNASAIAEAIDNFLISSNLSKEDCVGFGFDGCSTMAGKEGGVQAILRKKYPRALYFHCSSHKLNLVVNDANAVPEIRNTVATVKDVITFFRESTTRRNYAPNLSRLCETRWSEKYKSIRKFSQHFSELVKSLETLSVEGNYATRKSAYQLHSAVTKPVFIVSLQTIAKYSAVIEPVVNALQAKSIDMISVGKHIKNIKDILRNDREFPDRISNEILQKARAVAMDLNIEISVPRLAHKQTHRSNPPSDNDNEYWRRSLIIPYIDSLISSLNIRFSQENTPAFALSRLHPLYMTKTSIADLHKNAESFQEFYNLDITGELNLWHNLWVTKALSDDQLKDIEVVDLFKEANIFYPAVRKALIILSTIPCTTATVERSFSTLRRVKTWLRSTMGEERLTGFLLYCMYCTYNYSIQMKLKNRTRIGVIHTYRADPMCFCNRYYWGKNVDITQSPTGVVKQGTAK
nr:unnamed protein product [Callosobruchus analis]